ncbi:ABC transporter permease [Paenibacillus hodogayensis]|uniref:ABC transporter permease n=1 Tax=Paenibacillus hodogayensis TaxID=279208 RepID=A0ABV5VXZ0_9BACL
MRRFLQAVASERVKMGRLSVWLLLSVSPLLAALIGLLSNLDSPQPIDDSKWIALFGVMGTLHAVFMLPVLAGILAAWVCRYEHVGGGWKQLLALPVKRTTVYAAKLAVIVGLLGCGQLLLLLAITLVGSLKGITDPFPWSAVLPKLAGGWLACFPIAALQLGASLGWSSFGIPLALNVALTVPNLLILNSAAIAPFYLWAQPFLAMAPVQLSHDALTLPLLESMLITGIVSFVLFAGGGLTYFVRKDISG